jgi:hypothetical protein
VERTPIVYAVVSKEQELLRCSDPVSVRGKISYQDRGSIISSGRNTPVGLASVRAALKLLARRESQFAMVSKIRKQALSSRIQLLTTRRQFVAIITKHQELVVVVLLKENPSTFRRSNPDADARRNEGLAFTVTGVRHVNEAGARSHVSFRYEIRKSTPDVVAECGRIDLDTRAERRTRQLWQLLRTDQRTEQSSQLRDPSRESLPSGR